MTGTRKQVLFTQNTLVHIVATYLLFCTCYLTFVSFSEFLMDFCIYDDILDTIQITGERLIHFKFSKSGKFFHVDTTSFPCKPICIIDIHNYLDSFLILFRSEGRGLKPLYVKST